MQTTIDSTGIIISDESGEYIVVSRGSTGYQELFNYLTSGTADLSITSAREIIAAARDSISRFAEEAQAAVDGDRDEDAEPAYRVVHGDPIDEVVLNLARRASSEGSNIKAISAFHARLEKNPSEASRSQLFAWLASEGFSITEDGYIVGYKSVTTDFFSHASGSEDVTVTLEDGSSEVVKGSIPYPIGATVEMDRELVDDDRSSACSVGLHVGTHAYANGFGGIDKSMILVLVDPAWVVSVPRDHFGQKMRVHKLIVAAEAVEGKIPHAVITVPNDDWREVYRSRPENKLPEPTFDFSGFDFDPDSEDEEGCDCDDCIEEDEDEDDEDITDLDDAPFDIGDAVEGDDIDDLLTWAEDSGATVEVTVTNSQAPDGRKKFEGVVRRLPTDQDRRYIFELPYSFRTGSFASNSFRGVSPRSIISAERLS